MPQFPTSYDPNDPFGAKLNSLLGTDLRNPTSFMSQLEARKAPAQGVSISKKPKVVPQQTAAQPQTPPGQPTQPTQPTTPVPPTTATTPRQDPRSAPPSDARALARLAYENELSSFDEMTRQGREVTPLMRRRAMQRYENQIGKLKAVEATEASKAKFWGDVRSNRDARLAREQKSREYRAQARSEWEQAIQNAPPVKSIDDLNAEYFKKLGEDYTAQQQEQQRHSSVMGGMIPHRAEERADWLDPAIKNAVASAVDTLRQSPAGQLSKIAAPSTTTPAFGKDTPEQERMRNALADVSKFAWDLRHTPGTMNYDRDMYGPPDLMAQSEADQAAVDKSARDTFARLRARPSTPSVPSAPSTEGLTPEQRDMLAKLQSGQMRPADPYSLGTPKLDPRSLEASRRVSDRYRAMGVDPNHPDVYSKYASDVDRELAAMAPTGQAGAAPSPLPMGQPVGVLEGLANAGFGPGGLFGPDLPPDAAERAINMATTQNELAAAQGQAATGAMKEPFYVLAGGGMVPSMKGGAVPEMTAPQTRVIDNPMLRGRTNPTFSGPGRLGFNNNVMEVTPGRPARPVTVIPGAPGEIVDMPPTQAMPGVTPRDLPRSSGAERQGPMRPTPAAPVQSAPGPGSVRVQAAEGQGLFPFAERATNPTNAKNPNVIGQFKIEEGGPSFQRLVDPETGTKGAFTVIQPEGPFQQDRLVVFANVGGETIPFYRSQGGTSGKTEGSFYPFPGISAEDWLVKGSTKDTTGWIDYNKYYNNPGFKQVAEHLNQRYGGRNLAEARAAMEADFGAPVVGQGGPDYNIGSYGLINRGAGNQAVNAANALKSVQGPADPRAITELIKWNLRTFPDAYMQQHSWNRPSVDPLERLMDTPGQMMLPGIQ